MSENYTTENLRNGLLASLDLRPEDLAADTNLLQLGLDSIDMMAWLGKLRAHGFDLTILDLYQQPTLAGWSSILTRRAPSAPSSTARQILLPLMSDGEPFALTPVQHAYLVGRSPQQVLGGVGCHVYQEFDGNGMDAGQLEKALHSLIDRHPMLNVAFQQNGAQRFLTREMRSARHRVHDLRDLEEQDRAAYLLSIRDEWSHRLMQVENGEAFYLQLSLLPGGRHRLHINLDLLIADAASYTLLLEDIAWLICGSHLPAIEDGYDFLSYLTQKDANAKESRERAQAYWTRQLDELPFAPALPLAVTPEKIKQPYFTRRCVTLDSLQWKSFYRNARLSGLTAPMALATCYGAVLGRWTGQRNLLLNLTLFDRQPLHPAIDRMVADFTNTLLLDIHCYGDAFRDLALTNQHIFAASYEHAQYSGVEVMRDLKKLQRHPHGAPVVFTSNIGRQLYSDNVRTVLGEPGWGISQTPQVWLDHQALEDQNSILLQWDSNDELFPPGFIATLFDAYVDTVKCLADHRELWEQPLPDMLPPTQREMRNRVNNTAAPLPPELLHDGFFGQAELTPDATALFFEDRPLTYAELSNLAKRLASSLKVRGIEAGDLIAISMSRGIGQIVSVLGVLCAGGVYVPVSPEQPLERRQQICRSAGISLILSCATEDASYKWDALPHRMCWQEMVEGSQPDETKTIVSCDQPAYVIYTSGSTGVPKGVVISHRSALNTCLEITRRNGIRAQDRALAISALHFDLSVYDIFGILGSGGALVLLRENQRRDPQSWCALIEQHTISVWNSVPALFDMLLTYSEGFALTSPSRLRLVMLSGDWIGLDLPARYKTFRSDGALVAMGGATEAAIWSNFFEVTDVAPKWRSIPYGYPLTNQRFRVVDDIGRDCPDWTPGELWIGGAGVALGYLNDAERTAQQFVESEDGRWYRTGDIGCYWPDGTLEFLGRRDRQVKVGGHRIELEEIDAALNSIEGVRSGITLALGDREKTLVSFAVTDTDAFTRLIEADSALPSNYRAIVEAASPYPAFASYSEDFTARLGCDFLREHLAMGGIDFTSPLDLEQCVKRYGCPAGYRGFFSEWLNLLARHEVIVLNPDGRYVRGALYERPTWKPKSGEKYYEIYEALLVYHLTLSGILRGQRRVETLLEHPFWSPEALQFQIAGASELLPAFAKEISHVAQRLKRPVKLIEIGARSGLAAEWLLTRVDPDHLNYVALDESQEMVFRSKNRLERYANFSAHRWDRTRVREFRQQADITWANNSLHRLEIPAEGLDDMLGLTAPGGMLFIHEIGSVPPLALVSVGLFQKEDGMATGRLRDKSFWLDIFRFKALACDLAEIRGDLNRFVLRAPNIASAKDPAELRKALAAKLPSYMLPQRMYFLESIPLTANGKIDHKALAEHCASEPGTGDVAQDAPQTKEEAVLSRVWESLLEIASPHRNINFFEAGGDSLLATRMIGELDRVGYASQLADLFANPNLAAFAATLQESESLRGQALTANEEARYDPFPLTDVQQAYLAGRNAAFALGGIGSHFFMEFAAQNLNVSRFEETWDLLIARHDTLRTIIHQGRQRVLKDPPSFRIPIHRLRNINSPEADSIRDQLSHRVLNPEIWPVFSVQVVLDAGPMSRVFIGLDNLLLDGMSMQILMDELARIYLDPGAEPPPINIRFRDYLVNQANTKDSAASLLYWQHRLEDLPPAPQLPLRRNPSEIRCPKFARLTSRLSSQNWTILRSRAAAMQLTPASLLLTAYGAVLSNWSSHVELSLNVTIFDRKPVHPHIDRVLGDFTSLLILAWRPARTWAATASDLQRRLQQDIVHRDVSAIRIMRSLASRRGLPVSFPVVFTSALGYDRGAGPLSRSSWLQPVWGISQTPQVWLDHQVYEADGELVLNWDFVEELFDPTIPRDMFAQYIGLLSQLSEDESAWKRGLTELLRSPEAAGITAYPDPRTAPRVAGRSRVSTDIIDKSVVYFNGNSVLPLRASRISLTREPPHWTWCDCTSISRTLATPPLK